VSEDTQHGAQKFRGSCLVEEGESLAVFLSDAVNQPGNTLRAIGWRLRAGSCAGIVWELMGVRLHGASGFGV
ncbi:MAG: hypothetical protein OQK10_12310, partial [Marinobacter sp.]|nr:hypothetical protein [Marinobacter sp.]